MYDFDSYNVIIPLFFNYVKMLQERREITAKQVTKQQPQCSVKRVQGDLEQFRD